MVVARPRTASIPSGRTSQTGLCWTKPFTSWRRIRGTCSPKRPRYCSARRRRCPISSACMAVNTLAVATVILPGPSLSDSSSIVLAPDAVWDGVADAPQRGWIVVVQGERIAAVGPASGVTAPAGAERIALPGTTLIPGLIEGHAHLFLHPYNEALWDDQVLKEPIGFRMAEAVAHAAATLRAGVTTMRDLGTEGAFDYDVQLKHAIERGVVPGPRLLTVTRAIVATGSYGPRRSDYS